MKSYHGVTIGSYSYGCFDPDRIPPNVSIGRYVSIGPGVRVFPHDHPLDRLSTHPFFYNSNLGYVTEDTIDNGRMVIGNDTWIGANAIIVAGCRRIGDGAVIGAGSVVTRDIDDFQIVAGVPAKPLRRRFPDAFAQRIKRSSWWSRSMEDIAVDMDAMIKPIVGHSVDHPLLPSIRDHLSEPDRMEETV
jgi:acetyltransferase-like isoleucine patch superfamily enzyme